MPVIVGGNGPRRTPELAARFATEFNLGFPSLDEIPERIARVQAACERIGRDPATLSLSLAMSTFAGADDAEVGRRAARIGRTARPGARRRQHRRRPGRDRRADGAATPTLGIDRVYLQLLDLQDVDHVEYLGTEVLPQLPR